MDRNELLLEAQFTGHMYYKSTYESCDSCSNCNGARCDNCKRKYLVVEWLYNEEYFDKDDEHIIPKEILYSGFSKEKAIEIYNQRFFEICTENHIDDFDIITESCGDIKLLINRNRKFDSINITILSDNINAIQAAIDDTDKSIIAIRDEYLYVFKKDGDIFINYAKLDDEKIKAIKNLNK